MKVLMKSIEMIAWFTQDGLPTPVRFRMEQPDGNRIVVSKIRILKRKEEKLAGNPMMIFTCQSAIHGREKLFEIRYELKTCKWYIYKM